MTLYRAIGSVLPCDIGKRVYEVDDEAGHSKVVQVENNQQLDKRLAPTSPSLTRSER